VFLARNASLLPNCHVFLACATCPESSFATFLASLTVISFCFVAAHPYYLFLVPLSIIPQAGGVPKFGW
jgi:hypothetical protein